MNAQTMPTVELLAQTMATGQTPVQIYDKYTEPVDPPAPAQTEDEIRAVRDELRARIQFAWELARVASIKNRRSQPNEDTTDTR